MKRMVIMELMLKGNMNSSGYFSRFLQKLFFRMISDARAMKCHRLVRGALISALLCSISSIEVHQSFCYGCDIGMDECVRLRASVSFYREFCAITYVCNMRISIILSKCGNIRVRE
jgi:hypothetical protein